VADRNRRIYDYTSAWCNTIKPGSATKPFFGIVPRVLKEDGSPAGVNEGGYLVIEKPWPGMLRGTWGDPENKRIKEVYFSRFLVNTLQVMEQESTKMVITG